MSIAKSLSSTRRFSRPSVYRTFISSTSSTFNFVPSVPLQTSSLEAPYPFICVLYQVYGPPLASLSRFIPLSGVLFRTDSYLLAPSSDLIASVMSSGRIFTFQSRAEASLTCRHWLLDPSGCLNHQCRYSHTITGALSPPSIFACYAYNNGGCLLPQDQCLFAHLVTGPGNQYLQIRRKEAFLSHHSTPLTRL